MPSPRESEQKYKIWIGNKARRTNKKTTITSETTMKGETGTSGGVMLD